MLFLELRQCGLRLIELLTPIEDLGVVAKSIAGCIDSRGHVLDMASPALASVRQKLFDLDEKVKSEIRRLLRDPELRKALSYPNATVATRILGSHEYFHAMNVKRLRPLELGPFDYEGAPKTPSLWISEGLTTYYGEYYVATQVKLAPNAVVILNHACSSAGSSEPGRANPTLSVAKTVVPGRPISSTTRSTASS